MSKNLTITINVDGGLEPQLIADALLGFQKLLKELDQATTPLDRPRLAWKIVSLNMHSPLEAVFASEQVIPGARDPHLDRRLREMDRGVRRSRLPKYATSAVLTAMTGLASLAIENQVSFSITSGPKNRAIVIDAATSNILTTLTTQTASVDRHMYTALEGIIRQATVDPDAERPIHGFMLRERLTNSLVKCHASPEIVHRIKHQLGSRAMLRGIVKFVGGRPSEIEVDGISAISPDDALPTLRNIVDLGIKLPHDQDAADYIRGLRDEQAAG